MLIAFIPPYILMDLETKDPQYWDKKNDNISKNALLVLRMLYSTNTIVNPFIYGFFLQCLQTEARRSHLQKELNLQQSFNLLELKNYVR